MGELLWRLAGTRYPVAPRLGRKERARGFQNLRTHGALP
jgi:hypothetical protein